MYKAVFIACFYIPFTVLLGCAWLWVGDHRGVSLIQSSDKQPCNERHFKNGAKM